MSLLFQIVKDVKKVLQEANLFGLPGMAKINASVGNRLNSLKTSIGDQIVTGISSLNAKNKLAVANDAAEQMAKKFINNRYNTVATNQLKAEGKLLGKTPEQQAALIQSRISDLQLDPNYFISKYTKLGSFDKIKESMANRYQNNANYRTALNNNFNIHQNAAELKTANQVGLGLAAGGGVLAYGAYTSGENSGYARQQKEQKEKTDKLEINQDTEKQ